MIGARRVDPLDFPDDTQPAVPIFEFKAYTNPFELWETIPYAEPDGVYQPIHFALNVTPEQEAILKATQESFSQEIINCCHAYIEFYEANPKPIRKRRTKKKAGKPKKTRWQQKLLALDRKLKAGLLNQGWPGRLINGILVQARAKLDSANEIAKGHLKLATLKFQQNPDNHTHSRLQYWESRQDYNHFCLGNRKALKDKAKCQGEINKLKQSEQQTQEVFQRLMVLYELKVAADKAWTESRLWPIFSIGGEGPWLNKATFIRTNKANPTELEFVITYPRFLKPGHQGRLLPKLIIPIKLSERAYNCWQDALEHRKALTFTIQPLRTGRWRVTGVYKEPKAAKLPFMATKRLGIDQNAGFITVACVEGRRLLWVRKVKISQMGTTEEHEGRIYEAMKLVATLAKLEQAVIVTEDLNLVEKHKEARSKRARRHIQRIPYRKTQEILGRLCCREGLTLRTVNPAYTSVLGRFKLPGMNVHLSAAAMIAWRDLGLDQVELFQVGDNCLKIQGKDNPIVVEIEEGMPFVQSNKADPRFLGGLYRFIEGVNASINHNCMEPSTGGQSDSGRATASETAHGSEVRDASFGRRTNHVQRRPAAGAGPKLRLTVQPQPTPRKSKTKSKTVANTA